MDRNYIDMHLLTDRYLQGTLAESEQAEFEERLVWDQALIDEVDLAEGLRNGLQESFADNRHTASPDNVSILGRLTNLLAVPQYAAAASFLLAVTLTAGVLLKPLGSGDDNQAIPLIQTEILPLFAVRGGTAPTIAFNDESWTVLLVDVTGTHTAYRVTVRKDEPNAEPVWIQDGMLPTYPESLAIGMPGDLLADGDYVLSIEGVRESDTGQKTYEHVQDIPFQATTAH
jgi:hypothetical protein